MSYSRKGRMGLAIGVFLVLSLVVFGSIFYVAFSATSVEIIAFGRGSGESVASQRFLLERCEYLVSIGPEIVMHQGPGGATGYASGLHTVSLPF